MNALLWMARAGSPWRDLAKRLGRWSVVYQRYAYWCKKRHFKRFFHSLQQADFEEIMIEWTCCKAFLGDKTCYSDQIVQCAKEEQGMQVIIPFKANRTQQRVLDKYRYKTCYLAEKSIPAHEGLSPGCNSL